MAAGIGTQIMAGRKDELKAKANGAARRSVAAA
jgi:hypothetical protein